MPDVTDTTPRDTCDERLGKVEPAVFSNRHPRFRDAYRRKIVIVAAARLAHVRRATVYRWMADPAFVVAKDTAAGDFIPKDRKKVDAYLEQRRRWRQERERARHAKRCHYTAKATAARHPR